MLRELDGPVEVVSDPTYVVNCFRDRWYDGWLRRGWRNSNRKPVANRDLWEPLIELYLPRGAEIAFRWVKPAGRASDLSRADYLERIVAGRFPYAMALSARSRSRWFDAYVEQLVELDAPQIAGGSPRPQKLRAVLESCAARTGQELNKQATARDAGVMSVTADTHLRLLEGLSIAGTEPVIAQRAFEYAVFGQRGDRRRVVGVRRHVAVGSTVVLSSRSRALGQRRRRHGQGRQLQRWREDSRLCRVRTRDGCSQEHAS